MHMSSEFDGSFHFWEDLQQLLQCFQEKDTTSSELKAAV